MGSPGCRTRRRPIRSHQERDGRLPQGVRLAVQAPCAHRRPGGPARRRETGTPSARATRPSRPSTSSSPWRRSSVPRFPRSPPSSIRESSSSTPATTATSPSSLRGPCWSSEPGTRDPRSRWRALRAGRETWLAGRDVGLVPFRIEGTLGRLLVPFVFRVVFHRVLTVDTPVGRKARPRAVSHGGPLIRVKPKDLASAGVRRVDG